MNRKRIIGTNGKKQRTKIREKKEAGRLLGLPFEAESPLFACRNCCFYPTFRAGGPTQSRALDESSLRDLAAVSASQKSRARGSIYSLPVAIGGSHR